MFIKEFKHNPDLINEFIELGYTLYKDDNNWIPPIRAELTQQLSKTYSFYNKKGNKHTHFLLYENGVITGRVTAIINNDIKDEKNQPVGAIGFFECVNNYTSAKTLLDSAVKWHLRHNIEKIWGPMNFDIWHSYRFMTKGFDQKLFYGEPYNHAYYPQFFEKFGFKSKAEYDSVEIADKDLLQQMTVKGKKRYNLLIERGYRFEFADLHDYDDLLEQLHQIICSSFAGSLGFTPLDIEEFKQLFRKTKYALHPKMFLLAYNPKDELCGFTFALLELADAIKAMNGKNSIISKLKFSYLRRQVNRINYYIGGITPEEIANRSGLGRAGFYVIVNEILKAGYENMLLTLRLKGNAAHGLPGRLSPIPQREYKLYELTL